MTPVTHVANARDDLMRAVAALAVLGAEELAHEVAERDLAAVNAHLGFLCGSRKPPRERDRA